MVDRARRALLLSASAVAVWGLVPTAAWANDQQLVVDKARIVVESFLNDPDFEQMRVYVQNAYGVLIIPDLLKGGFFIGVEHGTGVLLARDPQSGDWSQPAFFDLWGGSFGLQFGGQTSDAIFTLMNAGRRAEADELPLPDGRRRQRGRGRAGCRGRRWDDRPVRGGHLRFRAQYGPLWRLGAGRHLRHASGRVEPSILWTAPDGGADRDPAVGA